MGDYKLEYFSPDEKIRGEGFRLLEVITNRDFVQVMMKFIKYLNSGKFRLIPGYLAHKDRDPKDSRDTHYLYIKEDREYIEESELEKELSEKVLEPVS